MNRNLTLLTALGAGLILAPFASAQAPAAPAAPATAAPAPAARIALVNFEQVVLASNEGQTVTLATQKKFEPKKNEIDKLAADVDSMKKSLQASPNLPDDERASRLRAIDTKEKQLNRDAEDAQTAYNTEWQEALGKGRAEDRHGDEVLRADQRVHHPVRRVGAVLECSLGLAFHGHLAARGGRLQQVLGHRCSAAVGSECDRQAARHHTEAPCCPLTV